MVRDGVVGGEDRGQNLDRDYEGPLEKPKGKRDQKQN